MAMSPKSIEAFLKNNVKPIDEFIEDYIAIETYQNNGKCPEKIDISEAVFGMMSTIIHGLSDRRKAMLIRILQGRYGNEHWELSFNSRGSNYSVTLQLDPSAYDDWTSIFDDEEVVVE